MSDRTYADTCKRNGHEWYQLLVPPYFQCRMCGQLDDPRQLDVRPE